MALRATTNGKKPGRGQYFVYESVLTVRLYVHNPNQFVITQLLRQITDHYGSLENIEKTFCEFMSTLDKEETVVINGDNPHYVELAQSTGGT